LFSAHIFVKSGSIYVKPTPKLSLAHFTRIVEYFSLAKKLRFCDICLNYPEGPYAAAATRPSTCLLQISR